MDLKKEIKLSDLFRRRAKGAAPEPAAPGPEDDAETVRSSMLERRRGRSLRRRVKDPDFDAGPERTNARRPRREKAPRKRRGEAQVPQIPLMRAFNLMPVDDPRAGAARRRPTPAQLVLAVVALVLLAAIGSLFLVMNARVADKQREYDSLRQQLAERQMPVQEPAPVAGDAALVQERDGRRAALSSALGTRVAWDRVLRELSLVLPEDVWLTGLTGTSTVGGVDPAAPADPNAAAAGESSFEIKGYARRHEGVALLLSRLGVLPEVQSASLVSATAVEVAGEPLVDFVLKATVKSAAGGAA